MAKDQSMNDQMRVRRQKMQELRDEGIDPFGHRFERDSMNADLHEKYGDMTKEELNDAGCNYMFGKMLLVKTNIIFSNGQI